ncbi:MAG: PmoA family protein [Planctomycetales bacterium]|nr:PmoA family protein [Planctomycetales bacterium]
MVRPRFACLSCCLVAAASVPLANPRLATSAEFAVATTPAGCAVTVDGKPFAEYVTKSGHQPIVWPLVDAQGRAMTRSYPMGPRLAHEQDDHPHHRSLWFAHGDVNGRDFWLEHESQHRGQDDRKNSIVHREFVRTDARDDGAVIVTRNDWMVGDKRLLEDQRTLRFGQRDEVRWVDFEIVLTASDGDVTFGDTKEGTFSIRVPGTMKVDEKLGGQLTNDCGQTDAEAWGREATWANYTGPVDGRPAGIAILCHPDSARYPTRWHARTYGLFAANPFALHDFPKDDGIKQGPLVIPAGESVVFRYLVMLHGSDLTPEQLTDWQQRYAAGSL